jgi:hypothetical protein
VPVTEPTNQRLSSLRVFIIGDSSMKLKQGKKGSTIAADLKSEWTNPIGGDAWGRAPPDVAVKFCCGGQIADLVSMVTMELQSPLKANVVGISWMINDAFKSNHKPRHLAEIDRVLSETRRLCAYLREFPYFFAVVGADAVTWKTSPEFDTWATA